MLRRLLVLFLARFRLSDAAVCEASEGMGVCDYHDYDGSEAGHPDHFATLACKRCGKDFII